jgi:hypothetical protein
METPARHLLFHGGVVLLIGLLAGFPFGKAIAGKRSDDTIRAWRVAHSALSMGATTMIAVAIVLSGLAGGSMVKWITSVAYIVCGYGFSVALITGPIVGQRGITPAGPAANRVVFWGNLIGVVGSLIGTLGFLLAAAMSL